MQITRSARQNQILETTVELVAELGYHAVTFAKIVDRAELSSSRLITYHFASRDELMRQVLVFVVERAQAVMRPVIDEATTATDRLAAYITGNLEFLQGWPAGARAAVEIVRNLPTTDDQPSQSQTSEVLLQQLFVSGQETGEMRRFDPAVMAMAVRAAIDATAFLAAEDSADLSRYADEIVEIFHRATRPEEAG